MKVEMYTTYLFAWNFGVEIVKVWENYWHINILCFTIALTFKEK